MQPAARTNALADDELMALVAGGDDGGLATLYERHGALAYSLAYRILRSAEAAEEVTQDAFVALWRRAPSYDASRGSVRGWLLGIVHHRAVDTLRRSLKHDSRRAHVDDVAEHLPANDCTAAQVIQRLESAWARTLVDQLPADQRNVIELAYFAGLTHTEIAAGLGLPLGTVKSRMRLALEKLRAAAASPVPA